MPLIALHLIDENGHNIRATPATAEEDSQLEQSIRALGVLQPVLLREGDRLGRYFVVAGHRRVRCGRAAGLDDIPAEILPEAENSRYAAVQAAENMVRVPMDPVDQWRAIVALQTAGYTLQGAADALGIPERKAKRLDKLGQVAPEILDLIVGRGLPDQDDLALIASAPIAKQREAFAATKDRYEYDRLEFIARLCMTRRISRNLAIFDIEASGIAFEEDLFAEPHSDDQFTTGDIDGFIKAQKAALVESINARKKKKERVALSSYKNYDVSIPKGFSRAYGEIKKRYPANGKLMLFMCVREDSGGALGSIERRHATENAKPEATAKDKGALPHEYVGAGDDDNDDFDADASPNASTAPSPETDEPALTKRGQTMLAAMKTDALRDQLDASTDGTEDAGRLLSLAAALVLALSADNVTVAGDRGHFSRTSFTDLRGEIVSPGGTFLDLHQSQLARVIAQALSRILRITDPATAHGSGIVAEWIGAVVGAEAQLPRFDTAEFLACMGRDALSALAIDQGRSGLKTAKGIREALTGSLPDWRPASFGAPGPTPPVFTVQPTPHGDEEAA
jgi:ParB family transcriptional regulator, chromosome partitioning protein